MTFMVDNGRAADWRFAAGSGLVAAIVFTFLHQASIRVTPDGWAYWQGATSILEGRGYRFFSGEPIVSWPPLYSLYLLPWIAVLGSTTMAIATANAALLSAQAAAWTALVLRVARDGDQAPSLVARLAIAIYFGHYLPLNLAFVRADLLMYALLPLFLLAMWGVATRTDRARQSAFAAALASLMVLAHHRGFLFIGAAVAMLVWPGLTRLETRARLESASGVLGAPVTSWFILRQWLYQWDSHVIGSGREAFVDSLRQLVRSTGDLLSGGIVDPPRLAVAAFAAVFAVAMARSNARRPLLAMALFVAIALVLTMAAFNLVHLDDDVDPRFVLFVPGLLVPCALLALDRTSRPALYAAAAVFILPLVAGVGAASRESRRADPLDTSEVVTHPARITSSYPDGPTRELEGPRLIAPGQSHEPDARIRDRRRK